MKIHYFTPLLIAGAPRSGTSLLCRLLDWNPSVLSFPREMPLLHLFYEQTECTDLAKYFKEEFVENDQGKQAMFFHSPSQQKEQEKLSGKLGLDIPVWPDTRLFKKAYLEEIKKSSTNLFSHIIAALGQATIKSVPGAEGVYMERPEYFVLKTPLFTERYADKIAFDVLDAKFIHILRDPISRYVSEKTMKLRLGGGHLVDDILPRAINDWNESVRLAITNKAKIGADRYMIVAYEDLVAMPEDVMRDIAEFLGIVYEDGLLNPTYLGMPIKANSSFDNKSYGIDRMGTKNRGHNDRTICLFDRMKLLWGIFSCHDSIVFYISNLRNPNLRVSLRAAYYLSLIRIKLFPSASIRNAVIN